MPHSASVSIEAQMSWRKTSLAVPNRASSSVWSHRSRWRAATCWRWASSSGRSIRLGLAALVGLARLDVGHMLHQAPHDLRRPLRVIEPLDGLAGLGLERDRIGLDALCQRDRGPGAEDPGALPHDPGLGVGI